MKDNKRPPTPEKDRVKSRGKIAKETYTPYKFGIDGDDDGNDRTPPKVAKYVNHWPQLLPDLCEPTANFEVPVGGIPPPSQRGNIDRRMRSILGSDNPKIQQWKDVQYADIKVTHESRLLAFDIFEVMRELDANHPPVPDGNKAIRDLNTYPHLYSWIRFNSSNFCTGGWAHNLRGEMRELTCYQVPSTPDCQADGSQSRQLMSAWTASSTTSQDLRDKLFIGHHENHGRSCSIRLPSAFCIRPWLHSCVKQRSMWSISINGW